VEAAWLQLFKRIVFFMKLGYEDGEAMEQLQKDQQESKQKSASNGGQHGQRRGSMVISAFKEFGRSMHSKSHG
jgi:hypothetical protein